MFIHLAYVIRAMAERHHTIVTSKARKTQLTLDLELLVTLTTNDKQNTLESKELGAIIFECFQELIEELEPAKAKYLWEMLELAYTIQEFE